MTLLVAGAGAVLHLGTSLARLTLGAEALARAERSLMPRPRGGSLVICGGGNLPERIREHFIELAGGPNARILIIPTANSSADGPSGARSLEPWKNYRVTSMRVFHTRSRKQADDPEFVRPLTEATGIWFGGGQQSLLTDVYLGTEVERQLKALLARGGVIGGTSAGAAVMSRVMIASGFREARLAQGFDFLDGAVVDQHFIKRNRIRRLAGVVKQFPNLIGLGIDETTALVVDIQGKRVRVIGGSYVVACLPEFIGKEISTRVEILKPGDEADLTALKSMADNAVVSAIDLDAL